MKICVICNSGNVGKTTIARQLLAPRIGAPEFAIESTLTHDIGGRLRLHANEFGVLHEALVTIDRAIVDVSANEGHAFIQAMSQYHRSHQLFDYFVIPVLKREKEQDDAIGTIKSLAAMGVPAEKNRVVFNMVDEDGDATLEQDFGAIYAISELCTPITAALLYRNEAYGYLWRPDWHKSVAQLLAEDVGADANLYASTEGHRARDTDRHIARRLAESANTNLDQVFEALFQVQESA